MLPVHKSTNCLVHQSAAGGSGMGIWIWPAVLLHTGAADDEADDDEAPMCANGCMAVSSQKSCSFESVLQLRAAEASNPCVVRWRRRRGPRSARHVPARLVQILKRCPSHQTLTSAYRRYAPRAAPFYYFGRLSTVRLHWFRLGSTSKCACSALYSLVLVARNS